jgi:hypothetical protein
MVAFKLEMLYIFWLVLFVCALFLFFDATVIGTFFLASILFFPAAT